METTKAREYKVTPELKRMFEQHFDETHSDRWNAKQIVKLEKLSISPDWLRRIIGEWRAEKSRQKEPEDIAKAFDLGNREVEIMVPESWYEHTPTYEIPRGYNNMLIVNDIHIPFHDVKALKTALEFGEERGIDSIYINGDLMDFYSISFFTKDPKFKRFKQECEMGEVFFQYLRKAFPNVKIFYKMGNHEERFERWLWDRAEELDGIVTVESLLKLKDYGVETISGRKIVKHGKLYLLHGHEIRVSSNLVNIARTVRLRTSVNTIIGHHHKTQEDYNKDLADQITGSWAVGCLCGLRPDYMPVNNWNHGFAHLETEPGGLFKIHNKKIVNGRIL